MAGDWIKWVKGLANRRETVVLASLLRRDRHEVAGRLMVLWEWCDDNTTEADADESLNVSLDLGDRPFAFVDALLGLPGMAEAMASPGVRWLEARSGGRITFPRLARHNGTSAKTRAYEADKKRRQRSREAEPSPEMSPKSGDRTGTREEKRREEKKKDKDPPNPPRPGGRAKKPRPANPLFDAVAEVTGSDPKASGRHVGAVSADLAKAEPPYTADEVREFGRRLNEFCPWAARDGRSRPTLGEVSKYIGSIRAPAAAPAPAPRRNAYRTRTDEINDELAEVFDSLQPPLGGANGGTETAFPALPASGGG